MEPTTLLLQWTVVRDTVRCVAHCGDEVLQQCVFSDAERAQYDSWFELEVLRALAVLWTRAPFASVRTDFQTAAAPDPQVLSAAHTVQAVVARTNDVLREAVRRALDLPPPRGRTIAFLIPARSRVLHEYADVTAQVPHVRVIRREFSTGWNSMTRTFSEAVDALAPDLLPWLQSEGVRTVISHNTYLIDQNFQAGYDVLRLCAALGIEWITCDFDTYDGSIHEQLVCKDVPAFRRFTIEPVHASMWLDFVPRTTWWPVPAYLAPQVPRHCRAVQPQSPLVFAANARAAPVCEQLPLLLWVLERCDPAHLYRDMALWYYGLRRIAQRNNTHSPLPAVSAGIGRLYFIYLDLQTLVKYITLDQLAGRYPVQIYGDLQWNDLFPQLYQHRYLSEADYAELFSRDRAIGLLANYNLSYVVNNPVFTRALRLGAPFVCHESLVCTPTFAAFRCHEYASVEALLAMLPQINVQATDPALAAARATYAAMLAEHAAAFAACVAEPAGTMSPDTLLQREFAAHDALWYPRLDEYVATHAERLCADMAVLFDGASVPGDPIAASRYSRAPFLHRLLALRERLAAQR